MGSLKRKFKRNKKHSKEINQSSMIGRIVDLSLEDFKKEVINQKIPIGVVHNLSLNLTGAYSELNVRKEGIINQILKGELDKEDEKVKSTLDGIYAEMIKIEQKVLYLKDREKELSCVEGVVDSPKQ